MDNKQPGFLQYHLPCCPDNPDNKIAQVQYPRKNGWMVNDDYTNKEDDAVDKVIEFNNCNDYDDNYDANKDNDDNNDLYRKVLTAKKRKKGAMSKQRMSKKTKSVAMIKCNNKSPHNNNKIINHDSVISCEGDADVEGDTEAKDDLDEDVNLFDKERV